MNPVAGASSGKLTIDAAGRVMAQRTQDEDED
jgi:hypothetical protein